MAIWKNAYLSLAGTDLSTYVRSLALEAGAVEQDASAMGVNTMQTEAGLKTWALSVEFNQSSTIVDATIWPLVGNSTGVAVIVRRSSTGGAAPTNPEWTGTGTVVTYNPHAGGEVGAQDIAQLDITNRGDLTRATST